MRVGRRRWRIDRFNRLIESDVRETAKILRAAGARAVVGIPFHKETGNLGTLVAKLQADLESRNHHAGIVVVGEHRTKDLLFDVPLPPSSASVTVTRFAKPFSFGQKPGLSRRSWSHWAILQIAGRCRADVVFIDADVRNSEGWVNRFLDAVQQRGAMVAVADYVRPFAGDDAIVHVWDSLIFGALFRKWVAFRHGGDYAISREFIRAVANDQSIMRERTYTMDSVVIARAVSAGGLVEAVWLGTKEHEPVLPGNVFKRLPDLVQSVFEDVATHLPALLRMARQETAPASRDPAPPNLMMRDLIGPEFRRDLHIDMTQRFHRHAIDIRHTFGSAPFSAIASAMNTGSAEHVALSPRLWAKATLRFLTRYIRRTESAARDVLAKAYVPILELGVLGFLNRTFDLSYEDSLLCLERDYLPTFQQIWNALSRRWPR